MYRIAKLGAISYPGSEMNRPFGMTFLTEESAFSVQLTEVDEDDAEEWEEYVGDEFEIIIVPKKNQILNLPTSGKPK